MAEKENHFVSIYLEVRISIPAKGTGDRANSSCTIRTEQQGAAHRSVRTCTPVTDRTMLVDPAATPLHHRRGRGETKGDEKRANWSPYVSQPPPLVGFGINKYCPMIDRSSLR